MICLGIETSCDETSIAVIERKTDLSLPTILYHKIFTQDEHIKFGGVVPEVASRGHLQILPAMFQDFIDNSKVKMKDISHIATTTGPGLIGCLTVGSQFGKGLALANDIPFISVNHIKAHILSVKINNKIDFPYVAILTSGGHCQIILVNGYNDMTILSATADDSAGEVLDKVARMLNLSPPNGATIEECADEFTTSNEKLLENLFKQPKFKIENTMSFSGFKSKARQFINQHPNILKDDKLKSDFCKTFQVAVFKHIIETTSNSIVKLDGIDTIAIVGGVAKNKLLLTSLKNKIPNYNIVAPPPNLCTDNGAMIAFAGIEKVCSVDNFDTELCATSRSNWSVEE